MRGAALVVVLDRAGPEIVGREVGPLTHYQGEGRLLEEE